MSYIVPLIGSELQGLACALTRTHQSTSAEMNATSAVPSVMGLSGIGGSSIISLSTSSETDVETSVRKIMDEVKLGRKDSAKVLFNKMVRDAIEPGATSLTSVKEVLQRLRGASTTVRGISRHIDVDYILYELSAITKSLEKLPSSPTPLEEEKHWDAQRTRACQMYLVSISALREKAAASRQLLEKGAEIDKTLQELDDGLTSDPDGSKEKGLEKKRERLEKRLDEKTLNLWKSISPQCSTTSRKAAYHPYKLHVLHQADRKQTVMVHFKEWLMSPGTIVKYSAVIPELMLMSKLYLKEEGMLHIPKRFNQVDPLFREEYSTQAALLWEELLTQCEKQGRQDCLSRIKQTVMCVGTSRTRLQVEALNGAQAMYLLFQSMESDAQGGTGSAAPRDARDGEGRVRRHGCWEGNS